MMSFDFTSEEGREADVSVDKKTQIGPRSELKPCEFYFRGFLDSCRLRSSLITSD